MAPPDPIVGYAQNGHWIPVKRVIWHGWAPSFSASFARSVSGFGRFSLACAALILSKTLSDLPVDLFNSSARNARCLENVPSRDTRNQIVSRSRKDAFPNDSSPTDLFPIDMGGSPRSMRFSACATISSVVGIFVAAA